MGFYIPHTSHRPLTSLLQIKPLPLGISSLHSTPRGTSDGRANEIHLAHTCCFRHVAGLLASTSAPWAYKNRNVTNNQHPVLRFRDVEQARPKPHLSPCLLLSLHNDTRGQYTHTHTSSRQTRSGTRRNSVHKCQQRQAG